MDDNVFNSILDGLHSHLIGPKKTALETLDNVLNHTTRIDKRYFSEIYRSILENLLEDIDKSREKNQGTILTRIENYCKALRKLVAKTCRVLKFKVVKQLLETLLPLLFDEDGQLYQPVLMDICKVIHLIISVPKLRDNFTEKDWIKLVNHLTRVLTLQFRKSTNAKFVIDLLSSLRVLLNEQVICFSDVKIGLAEMILLYFEIIKGENSSTPYMLEITNLALISLSTTDVRLGLDIIDKVMSLSSFAVCTNYRNLQDQFYVFFNIAVEFMRSNMEPLIEETNIKDQRKELLPSLRKCLSSLIQDYQKTLNSSLKLDHIEFVNTTSNDNMDSWFNFNIIRLKDSEGSSQWIKLLSIVKLLDAYYHLMSKYDGSNDDEDFTQSWKRRKTGLDSLEHTLQISESTIQFIQNLLNDADLQLMGLKVALFHVTNFTLEGFSSPFESVAVQLYTNQKLKPWVSVLIRSILAVGYSFSKDALSHFLRINLQMLKEPQFYRVACQTIIQIINLPNFHNINDKSLRQLLDSIFELPEINGPAVLSNDSLKFWVSVSKYGTGQHSKTSGKIVNWLFAKLETTEFTDMSLLNSFVMWMFGNSFFDIVEERKIKNIYVKFNVDLKKSLELVRFIMNTKFESPEFKNIPSFDETPLPMDESVVGSWVTMANEALKNLESDEPSEALLSMLSFSFMVFQLTNCVNLQSESQELKLTITRLLGGLVYNSTEQKMVTISGLMKFQIVSESGMFLMNLVNPERILADVDEPSDFPSESQLRLASTSTIDDFTDFGEVRREIDISSQDNQESLFSYQDLQSQEFITQSSTNFLLKYHSEFGLSSNVNTMTNHVIEYLTSISAKGYICGFFSLLEFYAVNDIRSLSSANLTSIIVKTGIKLLSKSDFSSSSLSRILISRFITLFFEKLLIKGSAETQTDVVDIVNFLMSCVSEQNIVYTTTDVAYFLKLSINIIKFHELIKDFDGPAMKSSTFSLLKNSGNLVIANSMDYASTIIATLDYDDQREFFDTYRGFFEDFDVSSESSTSFAICLEAFSRLSVSFMNLSLVEIFTNINVFHFKSYGRVTALKIFGKVKGTSRYDIALLELFMYWVNSGRLLCDFPFTLLNYGSYSEFVDSCKRLLYPVIQSRKTSKSDHYLKEFKGMVKSTQNLHKDSLSLLIPLSFTQDSDRTAAVQLLASKGTQHMLKSQMSLIILNFLNLLDLSDEFQLVEKIPHIKSSQLSDQLFFEHAPRLHSHISISVPVNDGIYQIFDLLKKTGGWTPGSLNFILKNILLQLTEYPDDYKDHLLVIRKFKVLYVLAHDHFTMAETFDLCLRFLSPFLSNSKLHDDVSILLNLIIGRVTPGAMLSKPCHYHMFGVFKEAVTHQENGYLINEDLKQTLLQVYQTAGFETHLKPLFSPFYDFFQDRDISLDTIQISRVLGNLSSKKPSELYGLVVGALDFVFRRDPTKSEIPYELHADQAIAELIHQIMTQTPLISPQVSAFFGRYLGKYYLETGDCLDMSKIEFGDESFERSIESHDNRLDLTYNKLLSYRNTTVKIYEILSIDYIIGYAMHYSTTDMGSMVNILDFEKIIAGYHQSVLSLDEKLLNVVTKNSQFAEDVTLEYFTTISMSDQTFNEWVRLLTLALLSEIVQAYPLVNPIISFFSSHQDIGLNVVNELWLFFMTNGGSKAGNKFLRFIVSMYSSDKIFELDSRKIKVLLRLCQTVRVGAINHFKHFPAIYDNLDHMVLYKLATHVGSVKFALLLFEEYCSKKQKLGLYNDSSDLLKIYEYIGDNDLFFGVPIQPSLDFALEALEKNGDSNSIASVMFNSAKLDSSIILNQRSRDKKSLVAALNSNDFNGLSHMLGGHSSSSSEGTNAYDWSWRLNCWDLPESSIPKNESELIYKLVKNVRDGKRPLEVKWVCCDAYGLLIGDLAKTNLMKQLGIVATVERIAGSENFDLSKDINYYDDCIGPWKADRPLDSVESIILIRRSLYPKLHESTISKTDASLAVAYECSNLGKLTRLNFESQKSINNAVLFDSFAKSIEDPSLQKFVSKMADFNSSSMLWNEGQTGIPIAMLSESLKTNPGLEDVKFPLSKVELPNSVLYGYLVKWMSSSRQKKAEEIMTDYVDVALQSIDDIKTLQVKSDVYHMIGYFSYQQIKGTDIEDQISNLSTIIVNVDREMSTMESTLNARRVASDERSALKREHQRLKITRSIETDKLQVLVSNRDMCIRKSVECYLKAVAIDDGHDNEDIDKFFAIWFENSREFFVNDVVRECLPEVPNHKFIPWMAQLTSRLSSDDDNFQRLLKYLIIEISKKHIFHSVYHILNLDAYSRYSNTDPSVISRMNAAKTILAQLSNEKTKSSSGNVVKSLIRLCTNVLVLASEKNDSVKQYHLPNLNFGQFWLEQLPSLKIPLPTMNDIPISLDGDYSNLPRILEVDPVVSVAPTGLSKPKIMKFILTDGSKHKAVLKGNTDDLRQDAIMEQVLEKVSTIFKHDKQTRKRNMRLRTYKVVPLGPQCGIMEFVSNSMALGDAVRPLHQNDGMTSQEASALMRRLQKESTKTRVEEYKKIMAKIPPRFRLFFLDNFPNVDEWFESRQVYTRGLAATSFVGYIMGLGDRHLNNILLDKNTSEPIHIDFGVTFDQGRYLPIPELVPFRLTRDLVDGLGITGVKGSFEKCSEHVYRVLRENSETILGILKVLELDPLHSWVISSLRRQKMVNELESGGEDIDMVSKSGVNASDAVNAIKACEYKLTGNRLSVKATVQELIQEATDVERLAVIFGGWSPFY